VGKREGKIPFGNVDVDGRIILKWILETGWEELDGLVLTQDKDKWLADVNTVTNLLLLLNVGNSYQPRKCLLAFQEGFFSMPPFSVAQQKKSGLDRLIVEVYTSHTIRHTYIHTRAHKHTYPHAYTHTRAYTNTHTQSNSHAHTNTQYTHINTRAHKHTHTHTRTHTHIRAHIHTHKHTHTHTPTPLGLLRTSDHTKEISY
jgi:hypothetical protein